MKLYAWQPRGHGQESFFVCAASEEEAREAVEREIERRKAIDPDDYEAGDGEEWRNRLTDYDVSGWGTDYYVLTVLEPGQVIGNENT